MARLVEGEREENEARIYRLVQSSDQGLREVEIAREVDMQRRTVNNYLRELAAEERIYKDGHCWHAG